jgi:hypothetical protein
MPSESGHRDFRIGLSAEVRKYGKMALETLVEILQKGGERDRVACARELLDRGLRKAIQAVDLLCWEKN